MEERIVAADPVLDPQGYQRELLALLGTSDPLEVMAATPDAFVQRTAGLAGEVVARRPAPREWSVAELLGHLSGTPRSPTRSGRGPSWRRTSHR